MTPESNAPLADPHIVGNAFVQKYYNQLYESPTEVHRFYHENSVVARPGVDGEMVAIKSLKAINDHIMSLDYTSSKIQTLTADSQASTKNGVATLVTGLLIGKDGQKRKFSQTFFLVPQKGSYLVLNDAFRYVSDAYVEPEATKEVEETSQVNKATDIVAKPAKEIVEALKISAQAKTTVTEPASAVANRHAKVPEKTVVNENRDLPKPAEAKVQEDAPKRSYATIVQSLAQSNGTFPVKASLAKPKRVEKPNVAPLSKGPSPIPEQSSVKTIEQPAKGGSIFVANLPMDATPEQLNEAFKGFGAIREDGIQVRSYTEKKNCFAFVAFENGEAIKNVLQAHKESPIIVGNRRASIEEKRANSNQNGSRSSARNSGHYRNENGYRKDGYKPRGNGANEGRGYGRRNSESYGDGKAYQNNGHGNSQAKN